MKKIISLTLSVIILLALSVPVFAVEQVQPELHACYGSNVYVSSGKLDAPYDGHFNPDDLKCFIYNEYYKIYADNYFEMQFNEYNSDYEKWIVEQEIYPECAMEFSSDGTAKGRAGIRNIKNSDGLWFLTVIFSYEPEFSAETNQRLASSLSEGIEVAYVGNSTPCVVVAARGGTDDIDKIIENENVVFVETAFQQYGPLWVEPAIFYDEFNPTAADARKILRYAAKIDGLPENRSEAKRFLFMSDTDFDGVITAADARTALRISAKLESGYTFSKENYSFWAY